VVIVVAAAEEEEPPFIFAELLCPSPRLLQ